MMGCQQRYTASAVEAKIYVETECTREFKELFKKQHDVCQSPHTRNWQHLYQHVGQ